MGFTGEGRQKLTDEPAPQGQVWPLPKYNMAIFILEKFHTYIVWLWCHSPSVADTGVYT